MRGAFQWFVFGDAILTTYLNDCLLWRVIVVYNLADGTTFNECDSDLTFLARFDYNAALVI